MFLLQKSIPVKAETLWGPADTQKMLFVTEFFCPIT